MSRQIPIINEAEYSSQLATEERQRALRALLRRPFLLAENEGDREDFARVRRHSEALRIWFHRYAGWLLEVNSECARLFKTPATLVDATRPACSPKDDEPFSRRRYVLLCLALAALVHSERQGNLGGIARAIVDRWNETPQFLALGLVFNLDQQDSRRDLVTVLRFLSECRVITKMDGDEHKFVQDQSADVLYNVNHFVIARMLSVRQPPSNLQRGLEFGDFLAALNKEPIIDDEEQKNIRVRTSLIRRILDDPVVYISELTPEEKEYLPKQRPHLLKVLTEATGLEVEDRIEGIALVDPSGDCTDLGLPEEGTDGHATLLAAEFLAQRRLNDPGEPVPDSTLEDFLASKGAENRRFWRRAATEPGAERELTRVVLVRLEGLGLIRRIPAGLLAMPAIHRYRHELMQKPKASFP